MTAIQSDTFRSDTFRLRNTACKPIKVLFTSFKRKVKSKS